MSEFNAADYLRDQAGILFKQLKSSNPSVKAGALFRLRRARPIFQGLSDEVVQNTVRKSDCLEVIASELKYQGWRKLVKDLEGKDGASELHDIPDDGHLKRICFSLGNSTQGALGAVIWVYATNAEDALEIAQDALYETSEHDFAVEFLRDEEGADYVNVYFNPEALSLADIELWEYVDEDMND